MGHSLRLGRLSAFLFGLFLFTHPAVAADADAAQNNPVWSSLMRTFATKDATLLTLKGIKEVDWFPHSSDLYAGETSWRHHFQQVGDLHPATGRLLSLAQIKPGKGAVVLLESTSGHTAPLVLIYGGERSFADESTAKLRSFFVYPYVTRCEFNTFPPRMHAQMLQHLPKQAGSTLDLADFGVDDFKYSKADTLVADSFAPAAGDWRWLQAPKLGKPPLFYPSARWGPKATFRILRPFDTTESFLANVTQMPCHNQLFPTADDVAGLNKEIMLPPGVNVYPGGTCFWQCYSDVVAYQKRGSKSVNKELVCKLERSLIDEYLKPMDVDQKGLSRKLRNTDLAKNLHLTDPQIATLVKYHKMWEAWLYLDENLPKAKAELHLHFHSASDHTEFVRLVEKELQADRPLLCSIVLHKLTPVTKEETNDAPFNCPIREVGIQHEDSPLSQHVVVIIGLRAMDGNRHLVYFQNGADAGSVPGEYVTADSKKEHIYKMDSEMFWNEYQKSQDSDSGNKVPSLQTVE